MSQLDFFSIFINLYLYLYIIIRANLGVKVNLLSHDMKVMSLSCTAEHVMLYLFRIIFPAIVDSNESVLEYDLCLYEPPSVRDSVDACCSVPNSRVA